MATPLQQLGMQYGTGNAQTAPGTYGTNSYNALQPGGALTYAGSNWPVAGNPGNQPVVGVNGLNINPGNLKSGAPLTILPAVGNATAEGNSAYNASQPLQNAYTNNLQTNPYAKFLQTGGTDNAGLQAQLSAYGINTQPQAQQPQQQPGQPNDPRAFTQPDGSLHNGLGVKVSADQVNGLTGPQQTQLNSYLATTTQQQQQAISSFQSEMEGRFGAGAISPEAAAVGQQVIQAAYQAQVDEQVASYQTQAQVMRQQGLAAMENQGVAGLNSQQGQNLAEQELLGSQSQFGNQLAVNAGGTLGNLGLGMSAQNNSLNLGSIISGMGSLGTGIADMKGAFGPGAAAAAAA